MYQSEIPQAEELLDSTAGPNGVLGPSQVLGRAVVKAESSLQGQRLQYMAQEQDVAPMKDALDLERPAKRLKPNHPSHLESFQGNAMPPQGFTLGSTARPHQSIQPWPPAQSRTCKC